MLITYVFLDYILTVLEKFCNNSHLVETYRGRKIYANEINRFTDNVIVYTIDKPYFLKKHYPPIAYLSVHDKSLPEARCKVDYMIRKNIRSNLIDVIEKLRIK